MTSLEWILLALLLFLPWGEGGAEPSALAVVHTAIFAAAAVVLLRFRRDGEIEARLPWPFLAYLPFLIAGGVSFLGAEYRFGSFETYWDQVAGLILALALACAHPSRNMARLSAAAVAASGAAQAAAAIASRFATGAAISPTFVNANHLAAYLNVAALVAFMRGGRRPTDGEALAFRAAGALCVAGTLAIGSRGALLALAATIGYAFVTGSGPRRLPRRALPLLGVLVLLATLSIQLRFSGAIDPYRYDRPRLWAAALAAFRDAPILGLGPGMYEHRALRHNFPQENAVFRYSKEPHSAHSQPLQVLAEQGIVGAAALLLFAAVSVAALAHARGLPDEAGVAGRGCFLAAAVVGIHALVETPFEAPAVPLTMLIVAWPALRPPGTSEAAASYRLRWPAVGSEWQARLDRWAVGASAASGWVVLFGLAVAAPYLAHLAARYAESPGRPPVRIDAAVRLSETLNPYQPFLGYRRARAALAMAERISPPLLSNALESLERTARLEPGDPGAFALMGRLYARCAQDLPGAGEGSLDAAERLYSEAIARAPRDARLWIERAVFRLARGDAAALADCEEAVRLEPSSLAARQVMVDALLLLGRTAGAAEALRDLDLKIAALRGYEPLNGYEEALLRLDRRALQEARERLGESLLVVPPGGFLRGGHDRERRGRFLGQDLIEQRLLGLGLPADLAVPVAVPVHAGLANDGLDRVSGEGLHRMVQKQLAARAVIVNHVAEAQAPLGHRLTSRKVTRHEAAADHTAPRVPGRRLLNGRDATIPRFAEYEKIGRAPAPAAPGCGVRILGSGMPVAGRGAKGRWYTRPPSTGDTIDDESIR